jgi:hypothetical protein
VNLRGNHEGCAGRREEGGRLPFAVAVIGTVRVVMIGVVAATASDEFAARRKDLEGL